MTVRELEQPALRETAAATATRADTPVPPQARARAAVRRSRLLRFRAATYLVVLDACALALVVVLTSLPLGAAAVAVAASLAAAGALGLYRSRLSFGVLDDLPRLLAVPATGGLAVLGWYAALDLLTPARLVATHVAVACAALVAVRAVAYAAVRGARVRGLVHHRALVVGAGHVGIRLARTLQDHRHYGLVPVGFLDDRPRVEDRRQLPAPVLGGFEDIATAIEQHSVSQVIVAFSELKEAELVDVLRTCDRMHCEIFYIPRLFELHNVTREADNLHGVPLVRIRRPAFRTLSWRLKRVLDVVLAAPALAVLAPVLAVCAALVRWETGPGVLFRQERVGLDGRPFEILKFRSLKPVDDTEARTQWNIQHDDRLGPVGRILRSTSLDELPQLWNVLMGHMSLVGPRPERPYFVEQYAQDVPRYRSRHRVPAGLTGWAQINGLRGDTSIEDRVSFDNHYIENWSLWGDVKIMLRTLEQVVGRRGG